MVREMGVIEGLYSHFLESGKVATDTRKIGAGSIFFALKGASFDGNKFALQALEQGAAYSVIDSAEVLEQSGANRDRLILVDDVLTTLQELANHHRRALGIKIVGITGSNGKTTTKELLTAVLSEKYRVTATVGNLNNHIGVPLTLLSMDGNTELGIVEMGASAQREIELLCRIAEPNFGIITNVGRAHLEGFGGEEGVRRGKGELFAFLGGNDGVAFVQRDDATISSMATEYMAGGECVGFDYSLADGVESQLEGVYNRYNIAAAVAIGSYFGVADGAIRSAIGGYSPQNNRSQRVEQGSNTLIMDCYNANPSSMQAAIDNFAAESFGKGKVAILGDMLELGEWADVEHQRVVERVAKSDVEVAMFVGVLFQSALAEFGGVEGKSFVAFADRAALCDYIAANRQLFAGRAILIKGSRGIGLEHVAQAL